MILLTFCYISIDAPFGSDDDDNAMVDVMASGDDSRTDKGVDFESMASELDRVRSEQDIVGGG